MSKNSLTRNASMAVIQAIVSGATLFLLYRFLLHELGAEQVGIWAIVLSTASASRITDVGFTGSALKFTAQYIARGEADKASAVIQTTLITIFVILSFVIAISYPVIVWVLPKIIPAGQVQSAFDILPYAIVSVVVGAMAGVFSSGLEGCQRVDLRACVTIVSGVLFLGCTWLLVPRFGLTGLAWAQICQGGVMLAGSRWLLQRELPGLPLVRFCWNLALFREMFHYGANFQVTSIFAMLFEPTTKVLMAKFGGLSLTAYYEMANRMVTQFRSLLVAANQAVVPRVAILHEQDPESVRSVYGESYRIMFFLAMPLYTGIVAITPLVSELWIGHYEAAFIRYSILLAVGYWINTLVGPAYFVNLGTGALRWNTVSHVVIGLLNGLLGYVLGKYAGGDGVVLGYVLALVVGSSLLVSAYHKGYSIPLTELFPGESRKLALGCFVGLVLGCGILFVLDAKVGDLARTVLAAVACLLAIIPVFWVHPGFAKLQSRIVGIR